MISNSKQVEEVIRSQVEALKSRDDSAYRNQVHEMNRLAMDIAAKLDELVELIHGKPVTK